MADLLDLPVDFDPATNTAYVGYSCISELVVGIWREVYPWGMHTMYVQFEADGTGTTWEQNHIMGSAQRRNVDYFVWHVDDDGEIVYTPIADSFRGTFRISILRDVRSGTEFLISAIYYDDMQDEAMLFMRIN